MLRFETYVKLKLLDRTFWRHQQLRMTKVTLCCPFVQSGHINYGARAPRRSLQKTLAFQLRRTKAGVLACQRSDNPQEKTPRVVTGRDGLLPLPAGP